MNIASYLRLMLLLLMLLVSSSCVNNSVNPSQMVQFCLGDENDVDKLIDLLERAASANDMKFINRSSASQLELSRLKKDPGYRVINISASRSDGLGFAAGNLGLGAHEIAIGFTNGTSTEESTKFVQSIMNILRSRWSVRPIAEGHGAMKSSECSSGS